MTIQGIVPDSTNSALTERVPAVAAVATPVPSTSVPAPPPPAIAPMTAAQVAAIQAQDAERVRNAAQQLDAFMKRSARDLEFRVDDSTHQIVVLVHDTQTGEVIRQIPSEEVLRIASRLAKEAAASHVVLDALA